MRGIGTPLYRISPFVGSLSRTIVRASVLLPDPLSPTMPTVLKSVAEMDSIAASGAG